MVDHGDLFVDAGSFLVMERRRECLAEREGDGAAVENLRAELLNDPHTLLLLPCIRMRLYQMSFTAHPYQNSGTSFFQSYFQKSWGYSEEFFQVCNELLSIAKSRPLAQSKSSLRSVRNTTYYYLVGLDILLPKAMKNSELQEDLARLISKAYGFDGFFNEIFSIDFCKSMSNLSSRYPLSDQCEDEGSASSAMVVAALVVLLYCVCQYLMLFVDRGRGSRSYASGSLDFRDVYISIVLFHGAYIWIKFRQAATSGNSELKRKGCEAQDHVEGVYRRVVKNTSGEFTHYKYEPRFTPAREKLDSGASRRMRRLSLGQYDTLGEAKTVHQVAAFYHGKAAGRVALEDGSFYAIPPMDAQEKRLTGSDKAKWVADRAKQVFKDLHPESAVKSRKQSRTSNAHSDPSHRFIAPFPALSTSVDVERSETLQAEVASAGAEQVADGGGSTDEAIAALEWSGVRHNVPGMENDGPEPDGRGNASGHDDEAAMSDSFQHMIAELFPGLANVSSQQSSLFGLVTPPQFDHDASQAFVGSPNLNCREGLESFVCGAVEERDLQQVVSYQKKLLVSYEKKLQEYAIRQREADMKMQEYSIREREADMKMQEYSIRQREADVKNSELQRENELLRAAKSQVEPLLAEFLMDFQEEEGRQFLGP